jgi:hypothetical protein
VALVVVDGGGTTGDPCGPFGHHGFEGIEGVAVDRIAEFVESGTPPPAKE